MVILCCVVVSCIAAVGCGDVGCVVGCADVILLVCCVMVLLCCAMGCGIGYVPLLFVVRTMLCDGATVLCCGMCCCVCAVVVCCDDYAV
jgi:hypothetical protein